MAEEKRMIFLIPAGTEINDLCELLTAARTIANDNNLLLRAFAEDGNFVVRECKEEEE